MKLRSYSWTPQTIILPLLPWILGSCFDGFVMVDVEGKEKQMDFWTFCPGKPVH